MIALLVCALTACSAGRAAPRTAPVAAPAPPPVDTAVLVIAPPPATRAESLAAPVAAPAPADSVSRAELTKLAVGVFGDSVAPPPPAEALAADAAASGTGEGERESATWDLDVRSYETHERVEHYVRQFSGPARDRIARRLELGSRYEPMIRAKFRQGGIPEDMFYLALIESGYSPHAYSRAAAVGMWQFMTSTARGMGMRVDWWVDERRDPARSTDGAIRFLRYLRDQFGSMYLAAAAYNGGPGRVSRGLTRFADEMGGASGDDRFFALAEENYLPAETKNYVPQLIAAALVGKEPARYGLTVNRLPPYEYDSVRVGPSTPLAAVAAASGTTLPVVVELNTHVLRGVSPPAQSFYVRVPRGAAAGFDSAFGALDSAQRRAYRRVISKKGETLASIGRRHGLTSKQLAWYNPKAGTLKSGRLRVGQTILVPSAAVVAGALDVPDPSLERYGSSARRTIHVVRKGESLSTIARRYRTTVPAIRRLNGLRKSTIFPGQALVVKGAGKAVVRKSPAKPSSKKVAPKKGSTRSRKSGR